MCLPYPMQILPPTSTIPYPHQIGFYMHPESFATSGLSLETNLSDESTTKTTVQKDEK